VPANVTAQLPLVPRDYARIQQLGDQIEYVALHGSRIPLDADALASLAAAGHASEVAYLVPTGALGQVPLAQLKRGDADCDGNIGLIDVIRVLQRSVGVDSPGVCLHVAGDVTCDGWPAPADALKILRFMAGAPDDTTPDCPQVGVTEPAALPVREQAALTASATPSPTATVPPDSATPSATATPAPSATP
jgi:hypothetical protein